MKNNGITDNERMVLLLLLSLSVLVYTCLGVFNSTIISPIVKLAPALAISFYVFIRSNFIFIKKKRE